MESSEILDINANDIMQELELIKNSISQVEFYTFSKQANF